MLDYLDELAGPDQALLPISGEARREALQLVALAIGVCEKAVGAFTEARIHDDAAVATAWLKRADQQIISGLTALQDALAGADWLGGARMNQADVTTVCAFAFANTVRPHLGLEELLPSLSAYAARAEATAAFKGAPLST